MANFISNLRVRRKMAGSKLDERIEALRNTSLFDPVWYRYSHSDLRERPIDCARHYIEHGALEGRNPHPLFDTKFYCQRYPDVVKSGENPLVHFLLYGATEGRMPNPYFDPLWYLERNPDVAAAGMNPLEHYAAYGDQEGRDPSPNFSATWYREQYLAKDDDTNSLAHYLEFGRGNGNRPKPAVAVGASSELKEVHENLLKLKFDSFLASKKRLTFTPFERPNLSIILILFNKAHFTYSCLQSLHAVLSGNDISYEIVVLDNGSTDASGELLSRCDNLIIKYSQENLGFLRGVNSASQLARGELLLLLNNDTELPSGTIEKSIRSLADDPSIGAVGGRLILPDGTLQEAGSIVWQDGSCLGYSRGSDPSNFEANFKRDVDYCSGAYLLTRTALFHHLGRFNSAFEPAYYEETDYCLRLWENGFRVVYDPAVTVFHFEFASASSADRAKSLQEINKKKFKEIHEEKLRSHYIADKNNVLLARHAGERKPRILVIDDRVPHPSLGSGFPRARTILQKFVDLGAQLTLCVTNDQLTSWSNVREALDETIEVAFGIPRDKLGEFLAGRRHYYDAIFVSRPHNMEPLNAAIENDTSILDECRLIYDAEAVFADRNIALRRLRGEIISLGESEMLVAEEAKLMRFASTVFCVSDRDRLQLGKFHSDVRVLGHTLNANPDHAPFNARNGILFVGALHGDGSPNADSLVWFIDEVMPLIRERLSSDVPVSIAGLNNASEVKRRLGGNIVGLGQVPDLSELYARHRIFIAPTRFAAGIPHKVHEAAAHGLPSVVTPLLAQQLGWSDGLEVLIGADPREYADACVALYTDPRNWAEVREAGIRAVERDCSPALFSRSLERLYEELSSKYR